MKEALLYKKLDANKVQCNLCAHHCVIKVMDIQRGERILYLGCSTERNICIMPKYLSDIREITDMDVLSILDK